MDIHTATEQAYKNGFQAGLDSIIRCRDCVYRWGLGEDPGVPEDSDHERYCFKHEHYTNADYFCADGAKS